MAAGEPLAWFETLYAQAARGDAEVPWAHQQPHPLLVRAFAEQEESIPLRGKVLVVGCGLGDDAEWLAGRGYQVTAFDLAPTAIRGCRQRFPQSRVVYRTEDLFALPADFVGAFDLVVEIITLQAMPEAVRRSAFAILAGLIRPTGQLLVISRQQSSPVPAEGPPWPLHLDEFQAFEAAGLSLKAKTFVEDTEEPDRPWSIRRYQLLETGQGTPVSASASHPRG